MIVKVLLIFLTED